MVVGVASSVAGLLFAVALAAPSLVQRVADDALATMPGYDARLADVDVSFLAGHAVLEGTSVSRPGSDRPFLAVERVVVRPRIAALLRGDRVVDVTVDGVVLNYVLGVDADHSQTAIDADWLRRQVERFPGTMDRLVVRNGTVHYRDHAASPDVHVVVDALEVDGTNLANLARSDEELFGTLEVRGRVEGQGRLAATARVDPYAGEPRFVVDARVTGVPLAELNDALRAYARFDAEAGTVSIDSHLEAADGGYRGVAKPQVDDLQVRRRGEAREEREPVLRRLWEGLVGAAGDAADAATPGRERISAEVRFSGEFGDEPALVKVLEVLPAAWFGALSRAVTAGSQATGEAAEAAAEAGEAAARERGDRRSRKPRRR